MVWDVYAIYHKDLPLWRDVIAKVRQTGAIWSTGCANLA